MKVFADAEQRAAVASALAGLLLVADVINRGFPTDDGADARIDKALQLANRFTDKVERPRE